jgi:hypothetical protein
MLGLTALALQAAGCGGSGKPPVIGAAPVTFAPTTFDFGTVQVGATSAAQEFTIKSTSTGNIPVSSVAITGNDNLHFAVTHTCPPTLARLAECKATVTFKPTNEGAKTGILTFTSGAMIKTAMVTGTGQRSALLTISPASHTFGRVAVGAESTVQVFTVTNDGGLETATIPQVVSHMDFPVKMNGCTAKLASKAKCEIRVAFLPTMEGERAGDLDVSSGTVSAKARLTGVGDARPAILAMPTSLDFGKVVVARKSGVRSVTLQNPGAGAISELKITPNNPAFTIEAGGSCAGTIAGNGSCTINVAFTPAARGPLQSELTITMKGGLMSGVAVRGEGTLGAVVQASAASLPFGSVTVGTDSGNLSVTLTNVGEEDAAGLTVALAGTDAAQFKIVSNDCGATLRTGLQGNSCTVAVNFKPTAEAAATAALNFSATPGGSGSVALNGTGVRSSLTILPLSADFLTGTVGQSSAAKTFTVRNAGTAASGNLRLTVTSDFNIVGATDACSNVPLGPGQMCTVDIEFSPTSAGLKAGNLTASADPGGSISATLTGTAISVGQLAIRPATAPFGSVAVGMASTEVVFTVENTGGSETGVVAVTSSSAQYSVQPVGATGCSNKTLKPNETCTVGVTFRPTAVGDLGATLTATAAPGGMATSSLTGAGLAPAPITFQNGLGMNISINDFGPGDTVVGMETAPVTVFVRNTGIAATGLLTTTLGGDNPVDFGIVAGTNTCMASLPAGSTCSMQIVFKPITAGDKTASITVSAATGGVAVLLLKGPAGGLIQIWHDGPPSRRVSSFDFGEISAGSRRTEIFKIKAPVVSGTFTINLDTVAPPSFIRSIGTPGTCTGASIPAGMECTIGIDFQPQLPLGAKMGTLAISTSAGVAASLAMTGTSGGPLQFTPSPHNFGSLAAGTTRTQVFTLRNNNTSQPVEALVVALAGATDYEVAQNTCPVTLAANTACTVTIRLIAGVPGTKDALLTATGTYQAAGATQPTSATTMITGLVTTSALLVLTPSTVDFSSIAVGDLTGVTRTVTVTNNGAIQSGGVFVPGSAGAPALPAEWALIRNDCLLADNTTRRPLDPNQSCTFDLRFRPTATGSRSGNTTVSASPGGVAALTLNGIGLSTLVVEPAAMNFDAVLNVIRTGPDVAANPSLFVTVFNRGSANIAAFAITLQDSSAVGASPGDKDYYRLVATDTTCGASLAAGASCVQRVAMDTRGGVPAAPTPGRKYVRLEAVDTGAPMTSIATSEFAGNIHLDASLSLNDSAGRTFGGVRVGSSSVRHFVEVRNLGGLVSGPLQVTGINGMALTNGFRAVLAPGTNPLTGNTACTSGIQLAANTSCDLEIDFTPTAANPVEVTQELWVWLTGAGAGPNGRPFTNPMKVSLSGTGLPAASVYLTSTPTDFGGAQAGTVVATGRDLTLNNASGAAATIDLVTVTGAGFGAPSATTCPVSPATLAAGATCTFTLPAFAPAGGAMVGRANGTLEVRATPMGSPQQVATAALTGRVLRPAELDIEPPTEGPGWGDAIVGTEYRRTFLVRNTGEVAITGAVTVTSTDAQFGIPGGDNSCAGIAALAPNATCSVVVALNAVAVGPLAASLNATAPGAVAAMAQAVTGDAVLASLYEIVSGAPGGIVAYGTHPVLSETGVFVVIQNRANGQTIRDVTFGLNDPVNFRLDTNPAGAPATTCFIAAPNGLAASEQCAVQVFFRPQSLPASATPPNVAGNLTVSGASTPLVIALNATAVSALSIATQSGPGGTFGSVAVNTTSAATVFRVTNAAGVPGTGEVNVNIEGPNPGDYRIATNGCLGQSLAAGGTCDVTIVFEPKAGGAKTARLSVTASPTNGAGVDLSGTGS